MIHSEIYIFSFLKRFYTRIRHDQEWLAGIAALVMSVLSLLYFFHRGLIVAYGDAESHLNIAKRVVSSVTPGFGQLGGNWPPFHHLMMLPFVWNDYLWRTGLAGSFPSMFCFVLSAFYLFKLIKLTLRHNRAAWIGTLIYILNPGVLYMQTTAMSELAMLLSLIGATYYFAKWTSDEQPINIIGSAFFVFMGSLVRYDSWFLSVAGVGAILVVGWIRRYSKRKIEGMVIFSSVISFAGIAIWMLWNELIFKDPFYFMSSPYSAKSQQKSWLAKGQLPSYHDILSSLNFYGVTMFKNTGYIVGAASLLGFLMVVWYTVRRRYDRAHLVSLLLLLVPFPFYVITLYMGISIILVPDLLPKSWEFNLFNVRYGLMMVPFAAVFASVLVGRFKRVGFALLTVVLAVQLVLFYRDGDHIVIRDAEYGLSARRPSPANQFVAKHYDNGFIMFDDFSRSANPIDLNIPMNKIVYVGNHPVWDEALVSPEKYVKWLIIRRDENDVLWQKFRHNDEFKNNYQLVYNWEKTGVYRRWDAGVTPQAKQAELKKMQALLVKDSIQ